MAAIGMIVVGLATVSWAVLTKEHKSAGPQLEFSSDLRTGDESALGTDEVSDEEWEKILIDVEKIKTEGLVTDVNVSEQIATIKKASWSQLAESRREEVGRHLAVYCGRVSGTDEYRVEIQDESGSKVGQFERKPSG